MATSSTGSGVSAGGTSGFGIGAPAIADAPVSGAAGLRFLRPITRDYQLDPQTGQLAQQPELQHRVVMTLLTDQGSSSAQPRFGILAPRIMGSGFEGQMERSVRDALRYLTDDEGIMRIDQVIVERVGTMRARVVVQFTDLRTARTGISDTGAALLG